MTATLTPRLPFMILNLDADVDLDHFAIVTYQCDPDLLQRLLSPRFQPVILELEGGPRGLVSAVTFRDRNFRLRCMPRWWSFAFWQTNYRAYVIDRCDGQQKVWFFGTSLGSPLYLVPRWCWRMPWHFARYHHTPGRLTARGSLGTLRLALGPSTGSLNLPGLPDTKTAQRLLTAPTEGWYHRKDGHLGTYRIQHPPIPLVSATVLEADFPFFTYIGLGGPAFRFHSVLVADTVPFTIFLPPRRLDRQAGLRLEDHS